jgi:hypothetical protein
MSASRIHSIQHAIIFLMAQWSGGAHWAHRALTQFLEQRGIPAERLITLDIDQEPELHDLPELAGRIHGWGETAVVKDGRVVFVTALGKDKRRIQERCEELLRAYEN